MKPIQTFSRLIVPAVAVFSLVFAAIASADEEIDTLSKALAKRFPNVTVDKLERTAIPGLYQLVAGSQVVYTDVNGRYMIEGDLIDMDTGKNFSEIAKAGIRLKALAQLSDDEMVVYQPEKVEHTINVVTDIYCPYCRKLHNEMDDYLDNNIKVRYILLPLKGKKDVEDTVSVWCADDRNLALDIAKAGGGVEKKSCPNPLAKHKLVSRQLGVTGTPAIVLEDGRMLPGYVPVKEVVKLLNQTKDKGNKDG